MVIIMNPNELGLPHSLYVLPTVSVNPSLPQDIPVNINPSGFLMINGSPHRVMSDLDGAQINFADSSPEELKQITFFFHHIINSSPKSFDQGFKSVKIDVTAQKVDIQRIERNDTKSLETVIQKETVNIIYTLWNHLPLSHTDLKSKRLSQDKSLVIKIVKELNGHPKNKIDAREYLKAITAYYGKEKAEAACFRYNLLQSKKIHGQLKPSDIHKIQIGLSDVNSDDLSQLLEKIKSGSSLSFREEDAIKKLGSIQIQQLKEYPTVTQLPPKLFNALIASLRTSDMGYRSTRSIDVDHISGIPGKYIQHGWMSYKSGRSLEDEERMCLYKELEALDHTDQAHYCEIMTKILAKKHLFYEQKGSNQLQMGMLIPGIKDKNGEARWYRVDDIIDSGLGKFAYKLVPATEEYGIDMPDLLLYRSSASLPTAMDSFTSYLNDLNILPPGYLSRNSCKEQELEWMTHGTPNPSTYQPESAAFKKERPLLISGHSLGSSNSQLALINLQKSGYPWPNREISLELFDSPAISLDDAKEFATWLNKQPIVPHMNFNFYVSKDDPVPLGGSIKASSYLGIDIDPQKASTCVKKLELTKEGETNAAISGMGPHGRIFLRGREGTHYKNTTVSIKDFNKEKQLQRTIANIIKLPFVLAFWGTVGIIGGIKRFFIGRRHHDSGIKQIAQKVFHALKTSSKTSFTAKKIDFFRNSL